MSGLSLFDPKDDSTAASHWTVSELTGKIKRTLEADFGNVRVVGEISGLSRPRSGHVYFDLKDEGAKLGAVIWKSTAARVVFDLDDGMAVRVRGEVTVYPPHGKYQLSIKSIEPDGIGALELAFRQMFERLQREGLFDPERKRPLPRYPRRIVVVTSPTGAAVRDFLQIVGRRWRGSEVLIAPARVQGQGAALEIAEAIALANQVADADLIVVTRGGGSLEDLWAFNEEIVARAIYTSRLPVVSAVGHEVDVTIADFVADFRALTPSEAAERCVPHAEELRAALIAFADRMASGLRLRSEKARLRIDRLGDRLIRGVEERLRDSRSKLDLLGERARCAMHSELDRRKHILATRAAQLDALSPLGVLARGYSLTMTETGTMLVRSAFDVKPGDLIRTRLAAGAILSRVESIDSPSERSHE
jgi:exodeoxyribonuclease VII large subunit